MIAFVVPAHERPALELRVNFGVFAGRQATAAEIDRLGARLLTEVESVTIVAEERYEIGADVEASVGLVRVELSPGQLPEYSDERLELEQRLVAHADEWATECVEERRNEP
jgi:hypothetical protein